MIDNPLRVMLAGSASRFAGIALSSVGAIATLALTIRVFGPRTYAAIALAGALVSIITGALSAGLGHGLARTAATEEDGSTDQTAGIYNALVRGLSVITPLMTCVLGVLVAGAGFSSKTAAVIAIGSASTFMATTLSRLAAAMARGMQRPLLMELPEVSVTTVRLILLALLAITSVGSIGWWTSAMVTTAVFAIIICRKTLKVILRPSRSVSIQEAISHLAPFACVSAASLISSRAPILILGFFVSTEVVSSFEPSVRAIEQVAALAPIVVAAMYLPLAVRLFGARRASDLAHLYDWTCGSSLGLTALIVAPVMVDPQAVMGWVVGSSVSVDPTVTRLIGAGYLLNTAWGPNTSTLLAVGTRRSLFETSAVVAVAGVMSALSLVPRFGPTGGATAFLITIVIQNLTVSKALKAQTGITPFGHHATRSLAIVGWLTIIGATLVIVQVPQTVTVVGVLALSWAFAMALFGSPLWRDPPFKAIRTSARAA